MTKNVQKIDDRAVAAEQFIEMSTAKVITIEHLAHLPSVSAKIRYCLASGMKRGEVAKLLNIRYQHVRNVELTPLKKG